MKKISKKAKRTFIIFLVIVLLALVGLLVYSFIKSFEKPIKKVEKLDEMKEYGYYLEDDATELYKKLYNELKEVLNKKEIDEEKYASLVAQLCVSDYYNLDNKMSKDDIGCTQFILNDYKENFYLESSDTVYKYVEQNVYGDRKQKLPIVKDIEVISNEKISYSYGSINDNEAYDVKVKVTYKENLGYPEEVEIKLVHSDKKLDIIYMY